MNDHLIAGDLRTNIRRRRPGYYVSAGEIDPTVSALLSETCTVERIREYDALGNFLGKRVFLHRLVWRRPGPTDPLPGPPPTASARSDRRSCRTTR